MLKINHNFRLAIATITVIVAYVIAYYIGYTPPTLFAIAILLVYFSAPPRYIFHPINVLTGYYFLFYCLALQFGTEWQSIFTFTSEAERITSCMNCATFLIGYNVFYHATMDCSEENRKYGINGKNISKNIFIPFFHILLAFLILCVVIALSRFPLSVWLTSPGTAYQDRSGTGYAIIMVFFLSGLLLTYGGYLIYSTSTIAQKALIIFLYHLVGLLLYIPAPSRPRLMYFIVFLTLPGIFYVRLKVKTILIFTGTFFISIFVSSILRHAVLEDQNFFEFLWRYCDIYYWTTIIVENEPVEWFGTSFIGFKKFLLGSGYSADNVYTVSQLFTEKYVRVNIGDALGTRTTIQFPVEVDMYTNAYYVFATPFLALFFWIVGRIYRRAFLTSNLGGMFVATYTTLAILPSCLRGMILEYTLLQNSLICFGTYFLLKNYYICYNSPSEITRDTEQQNHPRSSQNNTGVIL